MKSVDEMNKNADSDEEGQFESEKTVKESTLNFGEALIGTSDEVPPQLKDQEWKFSNQPMSDTEENNANLGEMDLQVSGIKAPVQEDVDFKRRSRSSSSSSHSEKPTFDAHQEQPKSPSKARPDESPSQAISSFFQESQLLNAEESISKSSLISEALTSAQPKVDKPKEESLPAAASSQDITKSTPKHRSSSRSPHKSEKKRHASKTTRYRRSPSRSPRRSSSRHKRKSDSKLSPRRGRSSSGSPSRSVATNKRGSRSRSSPRSRRHSYRGSQQSRKMGSRSSSSNSGAEMRYRRRSSYGRKRDSSSRYSPRGRQDRRRNRSPRRRSRSSRSASSSSNNRSPHRRSEPLRTSPKSTSFGEKSREETKSNRKSRSSSADRLSPGRKEVEKSPLASQTSVPPPLVPQRKLVQDYGSPSRHSDSSNESSKSQSKTPPDASTVRRQAQIIAAYRDDDEADLDTKVVAKEIAQIETPKTIPEEPLPQLDETCQLPLPPAPPPPPPPATTETESVEVPNSSGIKPITANLQLAPESAEVQDMEIDEEEENEEVGDASEAIVPVAVPPEAVQPVENYPSSLPCSLEDILLPGETRGDVPQAALELPVAPAVETASLWKAIPEATQPTVEVSTLELLQKQMFEESKMLQSESENKQEPEITPKVSI